MHDRKTIAGRELTERTGRTVWFDLPVGNLADAMSFYEGLLHWDYVQMRDSVELQYVMIQVNGTLIGGLRSTQTPLPRNPHGSVPILYFTVETLEPKIARAKELGAEIVGETVKLGQGRGRYQWIRDREGNLIGLWAME